MGYDCKYYFTQKTNKNKIIEFIQLIGYKRESLNYFYFFERKDYKSISGVEMWLENGNKLYKIHLHTQIVCSKFDLEFLNKTVRLLKERFGGYFISDKGKNRFIPFDGLDIEKAKSGCYVAFNFNFLNNIQYLLAYADLREFPEHFKKAEKDANSIFNLVNPMLLSNNLMIVYLVAIIEEYFKLTYTALLKYSPRRYNIFKNHKIFSTDIIDIGDGKVFSEEALSKSLSFQNIKKICEYFKKLEPNFDLYSILIKPYGRRRENFYQIFDRVF